MFKKSLFLIVVAFLIVFSGYISPVQAEAEKDIVYIFTSPTCPHCKDAKNFLDDLQKNKDVKFSVQDNDISRDNEKINSFYESYSVPSNMRGLVPAIFIGDKYYVGFNRSIGEEISAYLISNTENGEEQEGMKEREAKNTISLPIVGEIDVFNLSLPILAITLGIVDGFNVCSLGALVIILGLVMVLRSRRRIFLFGGAFIFTTAVIYGLLIFLWHQFFTFIAPYIRSMEIFIGLLALGGGLYLLREFYKAYKFGPVCSSNNLMSRLTPKIEKFFQKKTSWIVVLGAVVVFASIVTIVEFPCSAFLPVIFTGILVDSGISFGSSMLYIALYMIFYLLDEVIIFLIAVFTLNIKIVSPKIIIFFNLLAALIFIFLGSYYLFGLIA